MEITTDPNLLKWWAQYIESTGDMDAALEVYQKANDWLSQVQFSSSNKKWTLKPLL